MAYIAIINAIIIMKNQGNALTSLFYYYDNSDYLFIY